MDDRTLIGLGAALYFAGFLFALTFLIRSKPFGRWALYPVMLLGFIVQTIGLYQRGMVTGGCPLGNPFEILQFISWSIVLLYLLVGAAFRLSILGFFTAGLVAGLSLVSWLIPMLDGPSLSHFPNPWIELHAASAIFSYGAMGLLAMTSLMFLLQNYGLRHRRLRGLFSLLPSIRDLELINRRLLLLGTSVLTFSLILGSIYWLPNIASVDVAKLLLTITLWVVSLLLLLLHRIGKLHSIRFSYACIVLFLFALITVIPVDRSRNSLKPVSSSSEESPAVKSQEGAL
jgi:HemX protein